MFFHFWKKLTILGGIFWSIFYVLILTNIPLVDKLELYLYDILACYITSKKITNNIIILELKEEDLRQQGLLNESVFYADLVEKTIKNGASIVILNLLPNWINNYDYEEISYPIKSIVTNYSEQIVIVTPTNRTGDYEKPEIRIYNKFIPFNSSGEPEILPEKIFGFFEYDKEAKKPISINSSARRAYVYGEFIPSDNLEEVKKYQSFALLALRKYKYRLNSDNELQKYPHVLNVRFLDKSLKFTTFDLQHFSNLSSNYLANKIVLVGFAGIDKPHSMPVETPWGDTINSVELQANILANLINKNYDQTVPYFIKIFVIIIGSILITYIANNYYLSRKNIYLLILLTVFLYILLSVIFNWYFRLIFSLVLPIFAWILTAISIKVNLKLIGQQNIIEQQKNELNRLQATERQAIISYAKKLLHRVASNIHDGPLQELKMVMDEIELLEIEQENEKLNLILDKLENIGKNVRIYLDNTRNLSFEISPELRQGLDLGIRKKIVQLKESEEAILKINYNINKLEEPKLNSFWLESREDIFRFFCEAVNNVIKHAQYPYGNASYLEINLHQKQEKAILEIINDGATIKNTTRKKGGYGTKLMSTIASELPEGNCKFELNMNIYSVKLTWNMNFFNKN
jgi:signal transduction histidine kinase